MKWPKNIWNQLKATTCEELATALEKDGFVWDGNHGAVRVYRHPDGRRVTIHWHRSSYGRSLLQGLFKDIGWNADDLRRVGLIK